MVGIKVQAARFQLREAKLGAIAVPRVSKKPVGIVLGQKPAAGRRVKAGTIVTLVISKGHPHVSMPKLVGLKAPAATKVLQGVKLVAQLHAVSSSQPAGTVIGQSPRAGGAVTPRSHVVLEISRGSSSTTTAATSTVTVTATAPGGATTAAQSAPPAPTGSTGHDYRGLTLAQAIPRLGREQAIVVYAASSRPAGVGVDRIVQAMTRLLASCNSQSNSLSRSAAGLQNATPQKQCPERMTSTDRPPKSSIRSSVRVPHKGGLFIKMSAPEEERSSIRTSTCSGPTCNQPRRSTGRIPANLCRGGCRGSGMGAAALPASAPSLFVRTAIR